MPLVVDRARLPDDWPTNRGSPAFWEELGRTVAAFTHLEDMLARAYFGLTASRQYADMEEATAAFPQWEKALKELLTDSSYSLTSKLRKAFRDDARVPDEFAGDIIAHLDALRVWRNALCHGAWQEFAGDGSTSLRHFRKGDDGPEFLDSRLTIETISSIRAEAVALTVDVVDILSAAGVHFPGTKLPGADLAGYMKEHRD